MLGYDYSSAPCSSVSVEFVNGSFLVFFDPINYLSDSELIEYYNISSSFDRFSYFDFLEDFIHDW